MPMDLEAQFSQYANSLTYDSDFVVAKLSERKSRAFLKISEELRIAKSDLRLEERVGCQMNSDRPH